MDLYKWCHVMCQLWLLPTWVLALILPEVNHTARPETVEPTVLSDADRVSNVTSDYNTGFDSTTKASLSQRGVEDLSTQDYPMSTRDSVLRDLTTMSVSPSENKTGPIDKVSENKSSLSSDAINTPSSENTTVNSIVDTNVSISATDNAERRNSDSTTKDSQGFQKTISDLFTTLSTITNTTTETNPYPTVDNKAVETHLDIDSIRLPNTEIVTTTTTPNTAPFRTSTSVNHKSAIPVTSPARRRKPIVWTTPNPSVIRNMWLAKHSRSMTHTNTLHHLSLVPIEDGPFGSLIWRDKKYLITVLVPIGIGIIGAVCIIAMAYVVRFCHRHERKMQEIREAIQQRYATQNDQVILLTNSSDDEI